MTHTQKRNAVIALIALFFTAITVLVAGAASAHTPSGGATCQGYFVKAVNYEARDNNYISSTFDGVTTTRKFATNDQITGSWPQDAQPHTWSGYVHTSNTNPAFSHNYGPITLTCGTQPPDDERYQDIVDSPDCKADTITTEHQESHRSYTYDYETNTWVPGEWSPWVTTSTSSEPVPPGTCIHRAILKIRKFPSCSKSGRFVEIEKRRGWASLSKSHGPNRQRWVIKGKTKPDYLFHGETSVHKVIHLAHRGPCHNHSS